MGGNNRRRDTQSTSKLEGHESFVSDPTAAVPKYGVSMQKEDFWLGIIIVIAGLVLISLILYAGCRFVVGFAL